MVQTAEATVAVVAVAVGAAGEVVEWLPRRPAGGGTPPVPAAPGLGLAPRAAAAGGALNISMVLTLAVAGPGPGGGQRGSRRLRGRLRVWALVVSMRRSQAAAAGKGLHSSTFQLNLSRF